MDLCGNWIGRYAPSEGGRPISFELELIPTAEGFSGLMIEPDGRKGMLHSRVDGSGRGTRMTFRKCALDLDPGDDAVHSGLVHPCGRRVSGRWWFPLIGREDGSFSMVRLPAIGVRRPSRLHWARS